MIVSIKVRTGRRRFLLDTSRQPWVVEVTSRPQNNAANLEIIRELSRVYSSVRIIRGSASPRKTLEIKA